MTDLQKIKISVSILTSLDVAKNQEELGGLLGYSNKASFSQIVNGKTDIPKGFIEKLKSLDKNVKMFWENGFGKIEVESEELEKLKNENAQLMKKIISLQDELLDKSKPKATA
ncbi:hypothetical protein [Albibacterium profundi]|uniref:HTH cro/C1-type domain-containing protein n=1 Tax=Albibacterium profundi TaxID=3134906 RepID=A0ABV5CEU5_9SPHI